MIRKTGVFAGIQYGGIAGGSKECQDAIVRLLQFGDRVSLARVLTKKNTHCLLLTVNEVALVGIKSGFASGYGGGGPHAFSYVLALLHAHSAEIEEYQVDEDVIERLDRSALTVSDIDRLDSAKPVRPNRWAEYVFEDDWERGESGMLWGEFKPVIPLPLSEVRSKSV